MKIKKILSFIVLFISPLTLVSACSNDSNSNNAHPIFHRFPTGAVDGTKEITSDDTDTTVKTKPVNGKTSYAPKMEKIKSTNDSETHKVQVRKPPPIRKSNSTIHHTPKESHLHSIRKPKPARQSSNPTYNNSVSGESFKNCSEANAAGFSNIPSNDPHYAPKLDRDGDGVACEG